MHELRPARLRRPAGDGRDHDGLGFDYANGDGVDDELVEGGLGLAIIRALADEFELGEREGRPGSRLRFVKLLQDS